MSHVISVTPIFVHRQFREINVKISCNKEENLAELSPSEIKKKQTAQISHTNEPTINNN